MTKKQQEPQGKIEHLKSQIVCQPHSGIIVHHLAEVEVIKKIVELVDFFNQLATDQAYYKSHIEQLEKEVAELKEVVRTLAEDYVNHKGYGPKAGSL